MNRFDELKAIFNKGIYFKVVCGAGNEDPQEVRRLTTVYALAGATAIDVSANVDVVKSAVKGLDKAVNLAPRIGKKLGLRPFINVSIGLKGDPHIRKAKIVDRLCIKCGECIKACLQQAITEEFIVKESRCIGCGSCHNACPATAIEFYNKRKDFSKILPECLKNGAETLELHAVTPEDESVISDWKMIDSLVPNNFISMCLDRSLLSDDHLKRRIQSAYDISGKRFIVQADGAPMSGADDNYNTTLQAIAIADIINKSKIPIKIIASGGTNSQTGRLARLCGARIDGVAIGTFARKIVREFIVQEDFENNIPVIKKAVSVAEKLIRDNLKENG